MRGHTRYVDHVAVDHRGGESNAGGRGGGNGDVRGNRSRQRKKEKCKVVKRAASGHVHVEVFFFAKCALHVCTLAASAPSPLPHPQTLTTCCDLIKTVLVSAVHPHPHPCSCVWYVFSASLLSFLTNFFFNLLSTCSRPLGMLTLPFPPTSSPSPCPPSPRHHRTTPACGSMAVPSPASSRAHLMMPLPVAPPRCFKTTRT